ncbi:hypothetical protein NVP1063O_217 [Vibrio phage 1.063.O._10N.261.45.C7]|nr:hypothetical protein NVP1063O_217 [Vibrio phage 1.063.O._10N.261.45.C7]
MFTYELKMKRKVYILDENTLLKWYGTLQIMTDGGWVRLTDKAVKEVKENFNLVSDDKGTFTLEKVE